MRKKIILILMCLLIITGCKDKKTELVEEDNKQVEEKIVYKDLSIEYGSELPTVGDYVAEGNISESIIIYKDENDEEVEPDNLKVGIYKIYINDEEVSKLEITDTINPTLKLKEVSIKANTKYKINDFVESCEDNSKEECILSYKEEKMANYNKAGTYKIIILAKDSSDNVCELETKLTIKKVTSSTTNTNTVTNQNEEQEKQQTQTSNNEIISDDVVTYKYGTKITEKTNKNGQKYYEYDFTTFNGTTNDILPEAKNLVSINNSIYTDVLNNTNVYREEQGVAPLSLDESLSIAATIRAIEMAYSNKFSHTRPNNTDCFTVLSESKSYGWLTNGENIAYGYPTAAAVTAGWRNSPGHYANMIESSFTKLGVGYYKLNGIVYFVQLFGG